MKKIILKMIAASAVLGSCFGQVSIVNAEEKKDYFALDITYPGQEQHRYYSYDYSIDKPLNLSNLSNSTKKVKIKLAEVVQNGQSIDLKNIKFAYEYVNSDHMQSLIATSTKLSLPLRFLKASSYTTNKVIARFSIKEKDDLSTDKVDSEDMIPVIENNDSYDINKTLSFSYMKKGLYGKKNKGITITNDSMKINNQKIDNLHYSWWTSEYKYINKKWCATAFILSLNYPYKYDETKTYSAYYFNINRNSKGYLQGIKLSNLLVYTDSDSWGKLWQTSSFDYRDSVSALLTSNWDLNTTFAYKYLVNKSTILSTSVDLNKVKLRWKKSSNSDGYEIVYSTNKNFKKKSKKTVIIDNYKTTSKTIKDLKSNKKYYVKIRSFGTVDEKTYYSSYSKVKTFTTKSEND